MSAMSITLRLLLGEFCLASLVVSALLVAGCDIRHKRNTGVHITPGLVGQLMCGSEMCPSDDLLNTCIASAVR